MHALQTMPASRDARTSPPTAPDTDNIPFVDKSTIALPFALRLRADAATITADAMQWPPLDDVVLADVGCQPDNPATAIIAEPLVIPVELSPAGIVATARPLRGRGPSWE
jgi:hypothetical protein